VSSLFVQERPEHTVRTVNCRVWKNSPRSEKDFRNRRARIFLNSTAIDQRPIALTLHAPRSSGSRGGFRHAEFFQQEPKRLSRSAMKVTAIHQTPPSSSRGLRSSQASNVVILSAAKDLPNQHSEAKPASSQQRACGGTRILHSVQDAREVVSDNIPARSQIPSA